MAQVIYGQKRQAQLPDYSAILNAWYSNDQVNQTLEEASRVREETRLASYFDSLVQQYDLPGAIMFDPTAATKYFSLMGFKQNEIDLLLDRALVKKDLPWRPELYKNFMASQNLGQGFDNPKLELKKPDQMERSPVNKLLPESEQAKTKTQVKPVEKPPELAQPIPFGRVDKRPPLQLNPSLDGNLLTQLFPTPQFQQAPPANPNIQALQRLLQQQNQQANTLYNATDLQSLLLQKLLGGM